VQKVHICRLADRACGAATEKALSSRSLDDEARNAEQNSILMHNSAWICYLSCWSYDKNIYATLSVLSIMSKGCTNKQTILSKKNLYFSKGSMYDFSQTF